MALRGLKLSRQRRLALSLAVIAVCAVVAAAFVVLRNVSDRTAGGKSDGTSTYRTSVVLLGEDKVIGGLYEPVVNNENRSTGLVLTHENSNFVGNVPCIQLVKRGFTVLCVKSQYSDQAAAQWDKLALDVGAGVDYLRSLPSIHKVGLVGYSGGGPIMSYYQNVAQNGIAACRAEARLDPCGDDLAHLPAADGVVLLDSIPGIAFSDLTALDASVTDETDLRARDTALDMYSPTNGYVPDGTSHYDSAFVNRYLDGQAARENRLIEQAGGLLHQTADGTGQFTANPPMYVGRDAARIWEADTHLLAHTQGRYPLITPEHPDGGDPEVIQSVRVPSADPEDNSDWDREKGAFTANTFMSIGAMRTNHPRITEDSITGFDWESTNTATVSNVRGIKSPLLIMSMTGHYWPVASEMYYQNAIQAQSRTLAFVEGATHGFAPCDACATTPGMFGDTVGETFNFVGRWLVGNVRS